MSTKPGSTGAPNDSAGNKRQKKVKKVALKKDGTPRKAPDPQNPTQVLARVQRMRKRIADSKHPRIIEDRAQMEEGAIRLRPAAIEVAFAKDQLKPAEEQREHAYEALKKALLPVEWYLRVEDEGRKFVADAKVNSPLQTANTVLLAIKKSSYAVPDALVEKLEQQRAEAQAADDRYQKACERKATAIASYTDAKTQTTAAMTKLRSTLLWLKADERAGNAAGSSAAPQTEAVAALASTKKVA